MDKVDGIEERLDEEKYEAVEEALSKVWKKIKELRKSGLDSESGELSIGNLVFKLLRRNGYIQKAMDMRRKSYDNQFK
jgi:flagellin-specific chaperone FliS